VITLIEDRAGAPGAVLLGGRYLLDATPMAIGGSATVHRALDTRLDRAVAIKRPRASEAHARIRGEAAILARCVHPGVISCIDRGDDEEGAPFLVLELADGANLAQLAAEGRIDRAVARTWAREVVGAVRHLQARGMVHGDLKPQHVMIDGRGHAVLVDFDRAHLDGDGLAEATGIEGFAAPEVRAGEPTSLASDRYALGALLRWLTERTREA
jgi:serine/threonine protein kinase